MNSAMSTSECSRKNAHWQLELGDGLNQVLVERNEVRALLIVDQHIGALIKRRCSSLSAVDTRFRIAEMRKSSA